MAERTKLLCVGEREGGKKKIIVCGGGRGGKEENYFVRGSVRGKRRNDYVWGPGGKQKNFLTSSQRASGPSWFPNEAGHVA